MSREPYRRSALWYDTLIEPLNVGLRQIGLRMYPPEQGMVVLDVGCGTGTHLDLYQSQGCEVVGIDSSAAMLEVASHKLGSRAALHQGDAAHLPYADGSFDLAMITLTLHEIPPLTRTAVFNEMSRVLKPDGPILVIDYHSGPVRFPKGWFAKGLITFIEFLAGREHFRNQRHFLRSGGVPDLARQRGLHMIMCKIVTGGNLGLYLFGQE